MRRKMILVNSHVSCSIITFNAFKSIFLIATICMQFWKDGRNAKLWIKIVCFGGNFTWLKKSCLLSMYSTVMKLISFQLPFRQYWSVSVLTNKMKVVFSKVYFSYEIGDDWFPFTALDKHQVVQSISLSKSNNLSSEYYLTQCTEEVVEILLLHSRFGLLFITVLGLPTLSKSVKLFISKEGKFQATIYLRNIKY